MKFGSLPALMRRFRDDQRGNLLILVGLTLIPLLGVMGVAIDFSRASNGAQALNAARGTKA